MPTKMKLNNGAKCAVTSRLSTKRNLTKAQLIEKLEQSEKRETIERNAKNEAYYFILSDGSFRKFAEFHKNYRANLDYHGACLAQLYLDSFTTK